MKRRSLLAGAVAGTAALYSPHLLAQTYPSRPVRWVMPFPAGGPTDAIARKLAELASPKLGQPIVVENKPGASGSIGTGEVARSAPDGYTFAIAIPDSLIGVASLIKSVSYDARTDLTPVMKSATRCRCSSPTLGLVSATSPSFWPRRARRPAASPMARGDRARCLTS